ncbi:MAG: hypothetical protein ACLP4V_03065 [Methylocella sp.]
MLEVFEGLTIRDAVTVSILYDERWYGDDPPHRIISRGKRWQRPSQSMAQAREQREKTGNLLHRHGSNQSHVAHLISMIEGCHPNSHCANGANHIVPLSEPAQEQLRSLPQFNELVFPGLRGAFNGWSKAKAALDVNSGVTNWRLHDLRRTMATGLQRLGVRLEVTEQVLNHVSGSRAGIVGVYQRHDFALEKRAALQAWGDHVIANVAG